MINVHPNALDAFNKIANEILNNVVEATPCLSGAPPIIKGMIPVIAISDDMIIDNIAIEAVNNIGELTEIYFHANGRFYKVGNGIISQFNNLIKIMAKRRELKEAVSEIFIKYTIKEWIEAKMLNTINASFSTYFLEKMERCACERIFAIPINGLTVGADFQFGGVTFKMMNDGDFKGHDGIISDDIKDIMMKFQGKLAAVVKVTGEPRRVREIAYRRIDLTLHALRFWTPAALHSSMPNRFSTEGTLPDRRRVSFDVTCGYIEMVSKEALSCDIMGWEHLHREEIERMIADYRFAIVDSILNAGVNRLDVQEKILIAMVYFSKALLSDPADKILFCFVCLESLLLKNDIEPIRDTVRNRILSLGDKDESWRRATTSVLDSAYRMRSDYVHHGIISYDDEVFDSLIKIIWIIISNSIVVSHGLSTSEEFLDAVDQML